MCELLKCKEFEVRPSKPKIVPVFRHIKLPRINGMVLSPTFQLQNESAQYISIRAAFETVKNHVASLKEQNTDLLFLKALMESPVVGHLVKIQGKLEEKVPNVLPIRVGNVELVSDLCQKCDRSFSREAKELTSILRSRHFREVLKAHDAIGEKYQNIEREVPWFDGSMKHKEAVSSPIEANGENEIEERNVVYAQPLRMISLRKTPGQPLGVTVEQDPKTKHLVVARILVGSLIDRLGLLKIGDAIMEVNSKSINTPEQLQNEISNTRDTLYLKIGAPLEEKSPQSGTQCFMRALFTYDPTLDSLLPCKEIGLGFQTGDILQILDQSDPNWWQAKKVGERAVGLIPSRELEERRAAFVRPEADIAHSIGICGTRIARKKKLCAYTAKQNSEFDRAELMLYEEVTRMPPFLRKVLVIVGVSGVGRRTLKNRLINSDPNRFGTAVRTTTRTPIGDEEDMKTNIFVSKEEFEQGVRENRFLEFFEKDEDFYGLAFDTIRNVIRQGKMCIIDCNPSSLKILHNSAEFMPYVVFLSAQGDIHTMGELTRNAFSSRSTFERQSSIRYSSRRARTLESIASCYDEGDLKAVVEESQKLQRLYSPFFDLVVINEDLDSTFRRVAQALDALRTDHQWVPVSWVY